MLEKGSFTELQEKGILNITVDPLYQTVQKDSNHPESFAREIEQKETGDGFETIVPLPVDPMGLEITQEDRSIGVVSSKLYWNYFTSGVHWSIIVAVICLCFVAQGKSSYTN